MSEPIDQAERNRFIRGLDRNFSVVASAGSGKTRAITDRIIGIASSDGAREWLPTLVVVTFTNRAADEMQQRTRQRILEAGVSLEVLAAFGRAFFGTIHSFCLRLLHRYGHHLGLTGELTLLTEDATLWQEFVQRSAALGAGLTTAQRACLLRLTPVRKLMELGRHGMAANVGLADPGEFPCFDFAEVLAFSGRSNARANVEAAQEALRDWQRRWEQDDGFAELPDTATGGAEFFRLHRASLAPLREWLRCCSLRVAREVALAYRDFRLARGAMTYDDQVRLASALMRQPEAARHIRGKNHRVILDEAQDTDPEQFETLLEITRPVGATGSWIENAEDPPRPGHFCMVGDFQQSIFGERADLAFYRRVHDTLLREGAGEEVKFPVTFRLDDAQIGFVNDTFAEVLNNDGGQVEFVRLNARPQSLPGQVLRLDLSTPPNAETWTDRQRGHFEARQLAEWLRAQGLDRLRAETWRDVAILCPRKSWFAPLKEALREQGFDVQLQSERDVNGDSPAYAWLTALLTIMADPTDSYEIIGVLREVFGLSDHDLAAFAAGDGKCWQISTRTSGRGVVADALNLLVETRERIVTLPLFSAIEEIIRATQLRERLLVLPVDAFEDPGAELDDLLTLAAAGEAQARTLAEFAAELRETLTAIREVRPGAREAIQLITCHKAKGSEWQAIIMPFFGRGIAQRNRAYPRLLRNPASGQIVAALDRAHLDETLKTAVEAEQRQELERLLYVALSRAKHTLVIVDDRTLFRRRNKNAFSQLLLCIEGMTAGARFETLPTVATSCAHTVAQQHAMSVRRAPEQEPVALVPPDREAFAVAHLRAAHFRKRSPSALAETAFAESDRGTYAELLRRAGIGPTKGARYGTWWHEFAERIDWRTDMAAWDACFSDTLDHSPDHGLSRREWGLLREQLSSGTDFGQVAHRPWGDRACRNAFPLGHERPRSD